MVAREEQSYPRLTVRRQAFPRPLNAPAPTCWMPKPPSSGKRDQNPWSCPRNAAGWLEQGGCKHAAPVGSRPAISVCWTTFRQRRLSARTMSVCADLRSLRQGSAVTGPSPRWRGHAGHQGGMQPVPTTCALRRAGLADAAKVPDRHQTVERLRLNKGRCSGQSDAAHARGAVSATFPLRPQRPRAGRHQPPRTDRCPMMTSGP